MDSAAVIEMAAEVAGSVEREHQPRNEVTLSNGVKLKLRPVPPLAIREAVIRVPEPPVPMVYIADREREEPNPNDPDYLAAMNMRQLDQVAAMTNVMLLLGTSPLYVPEGMSTAEDDDWCDTMEFLGIPVHRNQPKARYLDWLRYVVLESPEDISGLTGVLAAMSGVTEQEVARAAEAFRNRS